MGSSGTNFTSDRHGSSLVDLHVIAVVDTG